jgi:hypothetical protein
MDLAIRRQEGGATMYLNTRLLGEAIRDSGIPLWELANLACVGADELV